MGRPKTIDTGIKKRLHEFLAHKNLSALAFSRKCGFSDCYVGSIKKTISSRFINTISKNFPELNIHWLETGEGQMLNEVIPINVQNNSVGNNSQQTIVAGRDNHVAIDEKGRQVIDAVRKMSDENIELKAENAALKAKVEMLTEQIEWLRTLVKQQN